MISMGRPLTPPVALIHSTARLMAFCQLCPYSAKFPVSGPLTAMCMGSPLQAGDMAASGSMTTNSSVMSSLVFITPPLSSPVQFVEQVRGKIPEAGARDQGDD